MAKRLQNTMLMLGMLTMLGVAVPRHVNAHGIWSHIHVTGWAIDNLPEGELRAFFSEPEVFHAALFGAAFCDSGYFPQTDPLMVPASAYSEHSHWEPFIEKFIHWIRENDPPPFTSLESKKRAAFLLGVAAHGLQDELFDSLYLPKVKHHDDGNQQNADPGSDGFLAQAGFLRFVPDEHIPMATLLELYAEVDADVTEEVVRQSVDTMLTFYINNTVGPDMALGLGNKYESELPWTKAHLFDPAVPGSVSSEVFPTMAYLQALWKRLHGVWEPNDVAVFWYPDPPRRLPSTDHTVSDAWVTLVYGQGVHRGSADATWSSASGKSVEFDTDGTRWGVAYGRMHRFMPTEALTAGERYTITVNPGLSLVDGQETTASVSLDFQVDCTELDDINCPELSGVRDPSLDGPAPPELPPEKVKSTGCAAVVSAPSSTAWIVLLLSIGGLLLCRTLASTRRSGAHEVWRPGGRLV